MPLRGALSVRIDDGTTGRHVTGYVRSLSFVKVAPGGHQQIRCQVVLPEGLFNDLGRMDRIYIYDTRTGRTIIDGYLKNPTPIDGPNGQLWDLTALGGMWRASDITWPVVYLTSDMGDFAKASDAAPDSNADTGDWVTDPSFQRVRVGFPSGSLAIGGTYASANNDLFARARMTLGAIRIGNVASGKDDPNWAQTFAWPTGTLSTTMDDTGTTVQLFSDDDFPTDVDIFAFRLDRTGGSTNVADDQTWTDWTDYSAAGQRYDRRGNALVGSAGMVAADQVLAHQVVEDVLSRFLYQSCDPNHAVIQATAYAITQLAYLDGTRADQILSDLATWEPDFLWEVLETLPSGLHRFNYRAWPTEPRYIFSVQDGWVETGSDNDLCNRQAVFWTDANGKTQMVTVLAGDLAALGLIGPHEVDALRWTREADPITLPEGLGSQENALQLGRQVLLEKVRPPRAGKVTVRRPVLDRLTGNMVEPWELEPGYVGQLREKGWDLRVTQMSYDDDPVAAELTLGTPVLTDEQRLARLDAA